MDVISYISSLLKQLFIEIFYLNKRVIFNTVIVYKSQGKNSQFDFTDSSDVFDVFPTFANRETSVVLRVANSSLLDFEKNKQFIFKVMFWLAEIL